MEKEMKLNNGVMIPTPGFGTFLTPDGATCVEAVKCAISTGYTHIDTTAVYGNEKIVRSIECLPKGSDLLMIQYPLPSSMSSIAMTRMVIPLM